MTALPTARAYKFLARGAIGPITRVAWPLATGDRPGDWLGDGRPASLCRSGVHACAREHLAYWLHEELWQVELDGETLAGPDCVISPRARLLQKIAPWSDGGGAQRFATAVRDHAATLVAACDDPAERGYLGGYVQDSSWHVTNAQPESPALAALCAAMAVAKLEERRAQRSDDQATSAEILEGAYRRERAWQSAWIAAEMELS